MVGARGQTTAEDAVLNYTESTKADARMTLHDIWGSQAHALMLAREGILTDDDARRILTHLEEARVDAEAGRLTLDPRLEDVHMNVESRLIRAAGREFGGKLHTARSRNDQVLADARLVVREEILRTEELTARLVRAFLNVADDHAETVLPGYTHTQHAQPITLGFWATAHASLLAEDLRRLENAYATVNRNPLGACALAGTTFPNDRHLTARLLGFDAVEEHALAAVSGRDFILETLFALAMLMTNLSRFAEEVVYWTTYEFRLMTLDDAYALGSSIMPQKKNPDIAEAARGRTGKVHGRLVEALTMLKGLPLGYHRDLQEDKPLLWESFDTVNATVALLADLLATSRFHPERMLELTYGNFCTATELANWLVSERGVPFRDSHEIVGSLVAALASEGKSLRDADACARFLETRGHSLSVEIIEEILDPVKAVWRNRSLGGTSPGEVRRMSRALRDGIARHLDGVRRRSDAILAARNETARCVAGLLKGQSSTILLPRGET
jgi:argininosuccinate lyase